MKTIILSLLLGGITIASMSQSISSDLISSGGDTFTNGNYQLDWSIGELIIANFTGTDVSLTQGFHQGTYTITNIFELSGSKISINAYPNPTTQFITVATDIEFVENNYTLTVTDIKGRLYSKKEISSNEEKIDFSGFISGTYIIYIQQNNQILKSFQIIKQ